MGEETPEQFEQRREQLKWLAWATGERRLDLQVMTTNLTNGCPMRLPIGRDRYRDTAEPDPPDIVAGRRIAIWY